MAQITLKGNPFNTVGDLPSVGSKAPSFTLVDRDLSRKSLSDFAGKKLVLNIFPSVDTPVCATSTRTFNERIDGRDDAVVACVSSDMPFAFSRFCGAEGLENVKTLSTLGSSFGDDYGVLITDGPFKDINARAVVVVDGDGTVVHSQLVPEIAQEPDYDAALAALD